MHTHVYSRPAGLSRRSTSLARCRALGAGLAALAAFIASISAAPARAADWTEGLYLEIFGGLHALADGDIEQAGATGEASYGGGQIFGAAVGKTLSARWALEAEFFYRSNDLDSVKAGPFAASTDGDFASTNLMFNALYSFTRDDGSGLWGRFTPFVGAGLGFLQEADIDAKIGGVEQEFDDNWIPAAQLIVGVSYTVNEHWSLFAETRYHYAGELELESSAGAPVVKADYDGLSGIVGLRYAF